MNMNFDFEQIKDNIVYYLDFISISIIVIFLLSAIVTSYSIWNSAQNRKNCVSMNGVFVHEFLSSELCYVDGKLVKSY